MADKVEPQMITEYGLIEGLCRSCKAPLQSYLTRLVGNPEIAQELSQESFAYVHKAYRSEQVMFPRAMLYRVATNFARMHLRRRRIERRYWGEPIDMECMEEVVADQRSQPGDRQVLADQIGQRIAKAITELRPTFRTVFVMAHLQGKSRREIAVALGVSEKRVDKRMSRALTACRKLLVSAGLHIGDVDNARDLIELVGRLVMDRS